MELVKKRWGMGNFWALVIEVASFACFKRNFNLNPKKHKLFPFIFVVLSRLFDLSFYIGLYLQETFGWKRAFFSSLTKQGTELSQCYIKGNI
ncbi:hypothetical protein AQUCO_00900637v1 [Aquilegia coerulea]|uniref:Uncharacterized protein n=1 Tax=Aquilegia coerulea TaxID=218851 RepID=A0A2G5EEP4_AQUCA|nr:hypothetical protein AQUCO_00900637v1 [Aquilegia coerulea]